LQTTYFSSVTDGTHATYYIISCTAYGADYVKKRTQKRLMNEAAHRQITGYLGKLIKRTYHKVDGNETLDYDFEGYAHSHLRAPAGKPRDLVARGRVFWSGDIAYSLLCATTRRAVGGDCDRFFNSFKPAASN
jgi:hypothetical protein